MKVELFAILKNHAEADAAARQCIQRTFAQITDSVEPFLSFEDSKAFYAEMGKAFGRADVVVAAADEASFLQQKWNMLKALGFKSEICTAVMQVIRDKSDVPDATRKAHALMPKDAAVFLTDDGLYSGFAMESGKQTLLYLPMINGRTQEMLEKGVARYFAARKEREEASRRAQQTPQITIPDNNERFAETAGKLADQDMTVAFASTQTMLYVRNGVRANPLFGDAFIPATAEDDPSSRDSATERMACLADTARREIGTTLGAAISNIYHVGMDSKELFLHVALADSRSAHVKKIVSLPGMSTSDLVALATDTLYSMLQDYAAGGAFPPDDADVRPLNLYEEGMQPEQENKKQKSGTAVKILVCVAIAVILCVLIGLFFKDDVAALINGSSSGNVASAVMVEASTEAAVPEAPTEAETEPDTTEAQIDYALFGTVSDGNKSGIQALSAFETPVYVNYDTGIRDYEPAAAAASQTVTTTVKETTTQATTAATTTAAATTTTTTAPAKAAGTTKAAEETTTAAATEAESATEKETTTAKNTESTRATTKAIITAVTTTTTTKAATTTTTTTKAAETSTAATSTNALAGLFSGTGQSDGTFTFTVYGYGHGVGMSQLGALAYARQGWTYDAIVLHYYPGTMLVQETPPATVTYGGVAKDTRDFLVRVVQQEIGGGAKQADIEALKAQAVAVYSFTKAKGYKLSGGDVAYTSVADSSLSSVVRSAVDAVYGQYLSYGGKAALATFYASSAGKTTSAQNVWGGAYAYLCGGQVSPETVSVSTCTITASEFKALIDRYNASHPNKQITLSGSPSTWIEILSHDGARGNVGYISSIRVGDKTMNGNTFRSLFNSNRKSGTAGLKSHCFSVQYA